MTTKTDKHFGYFTEAKYLQDRRTGTMTLDLPPITESEVKATMPNVSILTITKDRGAFAGLMLYNWLAIMYPREKLEWVILDDSGFNRDGTRTEVEYPLSDYIPQDDATIKYHRLDRWYPVAEKRNKAVELASYDVLVHMDDDDYYFPDHVLVKVRLMKQYGKHGVHSMPLGIYDLMERSSLFWDTREKSGLRRHTNDVGEASMAYTREYWSKRKFRSSAVAGIGEGSSFVGKQFKHWVVVHSLFNMIGITHTKNVTGRNRNFVNDSLHDPNARTGNFEDVFPDDFKTILDNLRKMMTKEYTKPTKFKEDDK